MVGELNGWETIVHHLGLAPGGRPAAAFANRLMIPVSNDTLLRIVRCRIADQSDELTVIGIDDFAFGRGQTYGTIVCDLERRKPVARSRVEYILSMACRASVDTIIACDGGGGYGEAIAKALPDAGQVADRWHLMENSCRGSRSASLRVSRKTAKTPDNEASLATAITGWLH